MAGKETGALVRREFGALVRQGRESRRIKLRHMAKSIGVSPTYLSKIELGDFDPPAEDKVRKIAEIIGYNPDVLLARAGRVGSDLAQIIRQHPDQMADLLRAAEKLTGKQMAGLVQQAQQQAERQKTREQQAREQRLRERKAREQREQNARERKTRERKTREQREQKARERKAREQREQKARERKAREQREQKAREQKARKQREQRGADP